MITFFIRMLVNFFFRTPNMLGVEEDRVLDKLHPWLVRSKKQPPSAPGSLCINEKVTTHTVFARSEASKQSSVLKVAGLLRLWLAMTRGRLAMTRGEQLHEKIAKIRIFILFCLLINTQCIFANSASDLLEAKLGAIHTMRASFTQVVKTKQRILSASSGVMALSRPGRFRWETKSPIQQLIVADGKRLWIYDVDLEQVTVKKQTAHIDGTAALFLSDSKQKLTRDFSVTLVGKQSFELRAKSKQANIQRARLVFQGELLHKLNLFDQLGQETEILFRHIQQNKSLEAEWFQFKRPQGVDWIEE